jgi:hypothetical protein
MTYCLLLALTSGFQCNSLTFGDEETSPIMNVSSHLLGKCPEVGLSRLPQTWKGCHG